MPIGLCIHSPDFNHRVVRLPTLCFNVDFANRDRSLAAIQIH